MEPIQASTSPEGGLSCSATGELVVQNGRLSGARRPLNPTVTFVGRAAGCEVRLNVDGVNPWHCVIARGPDGLELRDLLSETGTLVNGAKTKSCLLANGDILTVGPFRFRVSVPTVAESESPNPPVDRSTLIKELEAARLERETLSKRSANLDAEQSARADAALKERDALRIQAAAVVAQQAALTDEESRLLQRQVGLERKEEQLAAHLEDKRRHLAELQAQIRDARTALRKERADYEERGDEMKRDLERARAEVARALGKAETERDRFVELRRRLKRRWYKHWNVHEAALQRREQGLAQQQHRLEKDFERFQQEKADFLQAHLRHNGEIEVGRREVQSGYQELHQGQEQWKEQCRSEQEELSARAQTLEQREIALAKAERELVEQQHHWPATRLRLERETEGLESRVQNYRLMILRQQQEALLLQKQIRELQGQASGPGKPIPDTELEQGSITLKQGVFGAEMDSYSPPFPIVLLPPRFTELYSAGSDAPLSNADSGTRLGVLEELSGALADQRLHLAEQCQRLLRAQQQWQRERQTAMAELLAMGQRLLERERDLGGRERALDTVEHELGQRREELAQTRYFLDGWQARLAARSTTWESERERLLAMLNTREELVKRHLAIMSNLRRRWSERRRQEMEQLHGDIDECQELRTRYTTLYEDYLRRGSVLEQEQRAVAERALTLEQYRIECIGQAANSAAAEKHLERLRRRWAALSQSAQRALAQERRALQADAARLEEQHRQVRQQTLQAAARADEFSNQQTQWEHERALVEGTAVRLRQEAVSLRAQNEVYERQLAMLNEEVERMGRSLLDQADAPSPLHARAA